MTEPIHSIKNQYIGINAQRYSRADQERIAARMVTVLAAVQQGVDLEAGPFPVQELPLQTALETIERFT